MSKSKNDAPFTIDTTRPFDEIKKELAAWLRPRTKSTVSDETLLEEVEKWLTRLYPFMLTLKLKGK